MKDPVGKLVRSGPSTYYLVHERLGDEEYLVTEIFFNFNTLKVDEEVTVKLDLEKVTPADASLLRLVMARTQRRIEGGVECNPT